MRKFVLPLSVLFVLAALLLSPARYFASVQKGVLLFSSSVLPSMLPYFFFTKVLTATGCVTALAGTVGRPVAKLYRTDPIAAYPFLMSFLSGYPVGARVLADVYEKGLICKEDAARAASFCSTSGSMFVLGSVGAVVLKDAGAGAVILVAHYLGAVLNGYPDTLSGGEQQRAAILRALIHDPEVILLDEPTGNLDSENARAVMTLLSELNKKYGVTVVQVTHSEQGAAYGDRVITIKDGAIL